MRSTSRLAEVSINTVTELLVDVGMVAAAYHGEHVRNVTAHRIQCDEGSRWRALGRCDGPVLPGGWD